MTDTIETTATETTPNGNGEEAERQLVRHPDRTPLSQRDPVTIAKHFVASGFFKDAHGMSQAVVKIVAGEELGFGPMTAMSGIHIIEGKPSLSANLLATLVKRHPRYDFRVLGVSPEKAAIAFFDGEDELGTSEFTIAQAKRAGLVRSGSGWTKYPEAMLFARALSQGVRWHCPDVTAGNPAYTPEELGADVDAQGEVIAVPVSEITLGEEPAPPQGLDPAKVDQLEKGSEAVGITYKAFDLLLGSLGIDALRAHSQKARRERLASLTDEQAEALNAELSKLADGIEPEEAS